MTVEWTNGYGLSMEKLSVYKVIALIIFSFLTIPSFLGLNHQFLDLLAHKQGK